MAIINNITVNSIIGEGTTFRGDFDLSGLLRIDGAFEGEIVSRGKVLVGRHGSALTRIIKAETVIIGGKVKGDIIASEKVTILSTGQVDGDIETPRLIAEEGVVMNGQIKVLGYSKKAKQLNDAEEIAEAKKVLGN